MSESSVLLSWWEVQLARILSVGPIPKHVAFILDGNRRWASERKMAAEEGHRQGGAKGELIGNFFEVLGTKELTMYLFSIDNFRRTPKEVNFLMDYLCQSIDKFQRNFPNARYRIVGNQKLLSTNVQRSLQQLEENTKDRKGIIINMAIAYTCRDDITQGMQKVLKQPEDKITVQTLQEHMYTRTMSKVDILIRSSGETRFSDFLMWEVS